MERDHDTNRDKKGDCQAIRCPGWQCADEERSHRTFLTRNRSSKPFVSRHHQSQRASEGSEKHIPLTKRAARRGPLHHPCEEAICRLESSWVGTTWQNRNRGNTEGRGRCTGQKASHGLIGYSDPSDLKHWTLKASWRAVLPTRFCDWQPRLGGLWLATLLWSLPYGGLLWCVLSGVTPRSCTVLWRIDSAFQKTSGNPQARPHQKPLMTNSANCLQRRLPWLRRNCAKGNSSPCCTGSIEVAPGETATRSANNNKDPVSESTQ